MLPLPSLFLFSLFSQEASGTSALSLYTRTQSHFHKFPQVLPQLVAYNSRQTLQLTYTLCCASSLISARLSYLSPACLLSPPYLASVLLSIFFFFFSPISTSCSNSGARCITLELDSRNISKNEGLIFQKKKNEEFQSAKKKKKLFSLLFLLGSSSSLESNFREYLMPAR